MKVSGVCGLILVVGATVTFFNFLSPTCASLFPDLIATNYGDKATPITVSRKLKENGCNIKSSIEGDIGQVNLNDYGSVDPVPSTFQASVHAGPIEHGTPLNPYIIPKPSPPPKF
ncbi:uncharacterized protein LOC109813921 [Cajanus cajan]|uniref:uncharacterized protein LOC109813921 n=1 Tax=Cajanus cajan TaxID=3821 RepID=UPI00098D913C|nr:uncharacterized protein LOC109813921 [Cajanus cajan]